MEPIEIRIEITVLSDGRVTYSPATFNAPLGEMPPEINPQVSITTKFVCNRFVANGNRCCEKVKCRMRGKYKGEPIEIKTEEQKEGK